MINLLLAIIYLAFISLGLPDALLGSAWPTMSHDIGAQISWAGGISMVISAGTIVSALLSDRMTKCFGAGKVTFVSVALTALALLGFSFAPNYIVLIFLAIPYGLGAGGVDAALNNYVALHYEKPSYELASLYVGYWSFSWALRYGFCAFSRSALDCWIPVYCRYTDCFNTCAAYEFAVVEKQ